MQFLDEADLLADHIAILAAPGKLVASDTPVALKQNLGEGYSVSVTFHPTLETEKTPNDTPMELLERIRAKVPSAQYSEMSATQFMYALKTKDLGEVQSVLELLENRKDELNISSYDILGTSIEDVFLRLMQENDTKSTAAAKTKSIGSLDLSSESLPPDVPGEMLLTNGSMTSPFRQALTIFHKRCLIARRGWLTPVLSIFVAVLGCTVPLVFIQGREASCVRTTASNRTYTLPLYFPDSPLTPFIRGPADRILNVPPGIVASLGPTTRAISLLDIADNTIFVNTINEDYKDINFGGVSLDFDADVTLFAWEASSPGYSGASMLNLVSNVIYNRALNASGQSSDGANPLVQAALQTFPTANAGTLFALKWIAFFGAAMVRLKSLLTHPQHD